MRWFSFKIHTPFPIKGSLRWAGDQATVVGRIPLFTTLFLAAWLVGWTAAAVMMPLAAGGVLAGLGFLLLGWAFAVGICLFSVPFEIHRARQMLDEYEDCIASGTFS
jgi:hypothetical protein